MRKREESVVKVMKYGFISFIVLVLAAAAVILFVSYSNSYVATVGNEKITTAEFKFFLKQVKSTMLRDAGVEPGTSEADNFWSTTRFDGEDAVDYAKKKALEHAKELKVQVIKAKENNIKFEKDEEKNIEDYIDNNFIAENTTRSEADENFMNLYGVNVKQLKDIYKQIVLVQKFTSEQMKGIEVAEEEMEDYYNKYPDIFTNCQYRNSAEEAVWAKHILIKIPEALSEDAADEEKKEYEKAVEEARKRAEEVLEMAKGGQDFAGLAREHSGDSGSAEHGGDYVFGRGYMVPEFEKSAFDELKPGEISGLVKTIHGFHIIKLEEKFDQGKPVSLRCAKEYREFGPDAFKYAKYQERLDTWKNEYSIELNKSVYNSIRIE